MFSRVWHGFKLSLQSHSLFELKPDPLEWRGLLVRFLQGDGIEIGPLHRPLPLDGAHINRIRYVDRLATEQLRQHYPELSSYRFTPVDIIDDGEALHQFPEASLDFIIANHFIEHARNPIGTLKVWIGKLRPGGIVWMAIPNKHYTFDVDRPITSLEHLVDDDRLPAEVRKERDFAHYLEYAQLVDKKTGEAISQHAHKLAETSYSIHFHTFFGSSFLEILRHLQETLLLPVDLLAYIDTSQKTGEFLVVLSKRK